MSLEPRIRICFAGGPYDGRIRNVSCAPYQLASPVALPLHHRGGRAWPSDVDDEDAVAIYQLKNHNGDWRYDYLRSTTSEALGLSKVVQHDQAQDVAIADDSEAVLALA